MIKIDENELLIKGNTPSLMANLTVIIKEILDAEIRKEIKECSDILVKTLEKATLEAFKEVKDNGK